MRSYSIASVRPSVARVSEGLLKERIDASYYRSDHLLLDKQLTSHSKLRKISTDFEVTKLSGFEFTKYFTAQEFESGTVPFITSENVRANSLDIGGCDRISQKTHDALTRSQLAPGEIALSYTGHYRRAAVIPDSIGALHLGPNVCKLSPITSIDSYFVAAFLNCSFGQRALDREKTISAQPTVNMERIRDMPLPVPNADCQRYIGDKVRQAERLRERARELERFARISYRSALDRFGYCEVQRRKSYRTKLNERLDPAYYDPVFTSVLDADWLIENSSPLKAFIADGSYGDLPDSATYGTGDKWLLRATDIDQCMTHWDAGVQVPADQVRAKSAVQENDILLEVKGGIDKCAIGRGPAVGKHVNGTVFRLSPSGINPGYLCLHLSAEIKRKYASREAVNNIIQYLNLDCIYKLPVTRLGCELEDKLGEAMINSIDAMAAATYLTTAAKLLVEYLIEGRLSESDLVAAQQALEAGDRSADRAILADLRRGDAPDAPPLFPDLDALYTLLDETTDAGNG